MTKKEYQKKYREEHKEHLRELNKKWKEKNVDYNKNYYQENKDKVLTRTRKNYENYKNKPEVKERKKKYYLYNKKKIDDRNKKWIENNRDRKNEYDRKHSKEYYEKDILYKISRVTRSSILQGLKRHKHNKKSKSADILGCSFEELKSHLESKLEIWMNWENYGKYNGEFNYGWDIDHIIPVSSAKTEEELLKLFHFTNLQPLCSKINRFIKKNKIDGK